MTALKFFIILAIFVAAVAGKNLIPHFIIKSDPSTLLNEIKD